MLSYYLNNQIEAGCDEAGRGPLAGPVYAAAVILPNDFYHPDLNDSKQVSKKKREALRIIIEKEAISYAVTAVSAEEIDKINILQASITGMHRSLDKLKIRPEFILVDGNKFRPYNDIINPNQQIPYKCFIKGDATYASIAAASILAKTYRDEYMIQVAKKYPKYGWDHNMGYPTKEHYKVIREIGISPIHRKSFKLYKDL
ncbi:MAG: ribonuclease HII [Bacteroidales bacterium]